MTKHLVAYSHECENCVREISPGYFITIKPIKVTWDSPKGLMSFTIDKGFKNNLANIPWLFRWLFKQFGPITLPAIAHDWCFAGKVGKMSFSDANLCFLYGMESQEMGIKRNLAYAAVSLFGRSNWEGVTK